MVPASLIGDSEIDFMGDKFLTGVIVYIFYGDYFLLERS